MAEDDNWCGVSLGKRTPNRGGYAKRGEVVGRDQIREDHLRLISAALEPTHWRQIERVCVDVRDADGPFANRGVLVVRERLNPDFAERPADVDQPIGRGNAWCG